MTATPPPAPAAPVPYRTPWEYRTPAGRHVAAKARGLTADAAHLANWPDTHAARIDQIIYAVKVLEAAAGELDNLRPEEAAPAVRPGPGDSPAVVT